MAARRNATVFPFRTLTDQITTSPADPTEPKLHLMHSRKHTTLSKIASRLPAEVKISDPASLDVFWEATTNHTPNSEII